MAALGSASDRRLHATLSSTTVDVVTLSQAPSGIECFNRGTVDLWVSVNGATPVAEAAHCDIVPAGTTCVLDADGDSSNVVRLLGNANPYSLRVM